MCLFWRTRQRKLGIDDFGNTLEPQEGSPPAPLIESGSDSPVEIVRGPDEGIPVQHAVEVATESDVRAPEDDDDAGEQTPLLKKNGKDDKKSGIRRWLRL